MLIAWMLTVPVNLQNKWVLARLADCKLRVLLCFHMRLHVSKYIVLFSFFLQDVKDEAVQVSFWFSFALGLSVGCKTVGCFTPTCI